MSGKLPEILEGAGDQKMSLWPHMAQWMHTRGGSGQAAADPAASVSTVSASASLPGCMKHDPVLASCPQL
jgi:poly(3-hydroxyalkanoate) synthetase